MIRVIPAIESTQRTLRHLLPGLQWAKRQHLRKEELISDLPKIEKFQDPLNLRYPKPV